MKQVHKGTRDRVAAQEALRPADPSQPGARSLRLRSRRGPSPPGKSAHLKRRAPVLLKDEGIVSAKCGEIVFVNSNTSLQLEGI